MHRDKDEVIERGGVRGSVRVLIVVGY